MSKTSADIKKLQSSVQSLEAETVSNPDLSLDPAERLAKLVAIEKKRVEVVSDVWVLLSEMVAKLRKGVRGASFRGNKKLGIKPLDLKKLTVMLGIMSEKAQLMTGAPTEIVQFKTSKMTKDDRTGIYRHLLKGGKDDKRED